MCRGVAVPELAAPVSGIQQVQMWVCDLVMSQSLLFMYLWKGGGYDGVPSIIPEVSSADI